MKKYTKFALLGIIFQLVTINAFTQWIEWEKRSVRDNYSIRSFSVKQSLDGNIIVAGERYHGGYVYKANQFGDSLWTCLYAKGYSLTEDANGNIYSVFGGFLYKINSSGVLVWQKNLSDTIYTNINLYKIIKSFDNQLIIAGYSFYNSLGSGYIAKYNLNGNKIWSNVINFAGRSYSILNIELSHK